jgi:HD-GYP domain-containing protein (c-di-GMP phosphodiesterase class II)
MNNEPATNRAKAAYESLARRCAELGLALWHCDASGLVLVHPDNTDAQIRAQVAQVAPELCTADAPGAREISAGRWLVPLDDREGSRRIAMNLALVESTDPQTVRKLSAMLGWCMEHFVRSERDAVTIDQFSEKLAQAYEETNVLYRMARVLNNETEPAQAIAQVAGQLQAVLPFGWLAIRIGENSHGVRDLAGKMLVAGQTPCDHQIIRQLSDPMIRAEKPSERAMLLHPSRDELARAVGAEVLAEHITHDDKVIGLLLAGNKGGADPELSSFETQFLDATADFLGVFHENLSRFAEQQETFLGTLRALTAAIDAKDRYTRGHSERVGLMASRMAQALGMDRSAVDQFRIAGIVHDVGKIGVPEAVLTKPGRLTDEEFAQIKLHPGIGHHILQGIPRLNSVLPGVLWHHERWDGRGYPDKLAGDKIPLIARVLALADTFDAMSSTRSYRPALPRNKVLEEIVRCGGSQFDPELAPLFVKLDFAQFDEALEEHKVLEQRAA